MIANVEIIDTDYSAWTCFYIQLFLSPRLQSYWTLNSIFYDNIAQLFINDLIGEIQKVKKEPIEWTKNDIIETSLKIKIHKYS